MNRGTSLLIRRLRIEHERQRFVRNPDQVARVFGLGSCSGDDGGDPLAAVARHTNSQWVAADLWSIDADHERVGRRREVGSGEYAAHPRHGERLSGVDIENTAGRQIGGHQGDVKRSRQIDVARETTFTDHKSTVLASTTLGRDETVSTQICHRRASPGEVLAPRRRWAASSIASMIWT